MRWWCHHVGRMLMVTITVTQVVNAQRTASPAGLTIVVIEGEDAVNIIQQKTAVAPVVEVRDRNNQPVSGAVVRFAIRRGRATFNGTRTLTVTTNAAGRAAVTGLTPTGSGALQISASAAFQGHTAVATIAQINVMTAAQATSVAGASAAGGAAGGGVGSGISATTIGIVGGAVAGGALVTTQALDGSEAANPSRYQGSFSIDTTETITNRRNGVVVGNCSWRIVIAGTMIADLESPANGTLSGHIDTNWTETEVSRTCSSPLPAYSDSYGQDVSGPSANLQLNRTFSGSVSNGTVTRTLAFTGGLSGEVINGTVSLSFTGLVLAPNGEDVTQTYPLSSGAITLQKQ